MFYCEPISPGPPSVPPKTIPAIEFYSNSLPIEQQLPIKFNNNFVISEIKGCCHDCHTELPDNDFRGILSFRITLCYLLGVGYCPSCKIYTLFRVNFYQDQTVIHVQTDDTLQYGKFHKPRAVVTFFEKIANWFK